VIYGSRGEVLLEPTASKEAIRRAIERLAPGGSTNAEEGLDLAYGLARRYYREGVINRVILCSDGVANVGRTGADSILSSIRVAADEGIELTTVGFGMGNYNDVLMEQLADQGDGAYAYVDTLEEARRIFVENLTGTLQTIAADTKAQVEFNREAVSRYRLLGYENRDIADERFRDDTVDAGEIGSGHAVTALYEIKLHENVGRRARLATFRLRYRSKATDEMVESSIDLRLRDLAPSWERASTQLQLSSLAAEFAEILKGAFWAKDSDLQEVSRRLEWVADDGVEGETQDLLDLVNRARQLSLRQRESIVD
jgi:Ca-activated chloride channel family protein